MSWDALRAEVRVEMRGLGERGRDEARAVLEKLRAAYLLEEQQRRKRRTLVAMRARLRARPAIACALCGAEFVPYRSDTSYCTKACRKRANAHRHYRVRKANAPKHAAHLRRRQQRYAGSRAAVREAA